MVAHWLRRYLSTSGLWVWIPLYPPRRDLGQVLNLQLPVAHRRETRESIRAVLGVVVDLKGLLLVRVDLKRRSRNSLNEWMNYGHMIIIFNNPTSRGDIEVEWMRMTSSCVCARIHCCDADEFELLTTSFPLLWVSESFRLGAIHLWRPQKKSCFYPPSPLSTCVHMGWTPSPLWTSTHGRHEIHPALFK